MKRVLRILLCLVIPSVVSCESSDAPPPSASSEVETRTATAATGESAGAPGPAGPRGVSPGVAAQSHARSSARHLGQTLKERLQEVLAESGPVAAVRVCSAEANEIVSDLESQGSLRVGRSSLRLRNPQNTAPDWVEAWLREQGERPAEGVEGLSGEAGQARFLAPIVVEPLCLTCHGPVESIPADVRAVLRELYPDDHAVGYAEGDLRGALWAESLAFP